MKTMLKKYPLSFITAVIAALILLASTAILFTGKVDAEEFPSTNEPVIEVHMPTPEPLDDDPLLYAPRGNEYDPEQTEVPIATETPVKEAPVEEFVILDPLVEPKEFLPAAEYHTQRQADLHEIAESARELGLEESNPIIVEAKRLWAEEKLSLDIMAKTIWFESGEAPWQHILDVGCVVKNRVDSPYWPNTVYEVVSAPGQYNTIYCSGFEGIPARYYAAAVLVMDETYSIPKNVTYQANFKQGGGVWRESYVDTGHFRSMTYFCYDIERN